MRMIRPFRWEKVLEEVLDGSLKCQTRVKWCRNVTHSSVKDDFAAQVQHFIAVPSHSP